MNNKKKNYFSHKTSIIDKSAKIGKATKIWHFSHVMKYSKIGSNCILGQNTHIGPNVKIGNNCKIQNNVSIYEGVVLKDKVFCGPSCVFTNVLNPRSELNRKKEFQKTIVETGVTIGANATIICGITLNEYCFIGAGSVVTKNVPAYALMVGSPAKRVGWVGKDGIKLNKKLERLKSEKKYKLIKKEKN